MTGLPQRAGQIVAASNVVGSSRYKVAENFGRGLEVSGCETDFALVVQGFQGSFCRSNVKGDLSWMNLNSRNCSRTFL